MNVSHKSTCGLTHLAGETRQQLLYFSQETAQRWGPPGAAPDDGAALWLPGRLLVQLRMVPPVRTPDCLNTEHRE